MKHAGIEHQAEQKAYAGNGQQTGKGIAALYGRGFDDGIGVVTVANHKMHLSGGA